jgi:hypothetical protein
MGGNLDFADNDHPRGLFGPNVNPKTGVEFRAARAICTKAACLNDEPSAKLKPTREKYISE